MLCNYIDDLFFEILGINKDCNSLIHTKLAKKMDIILFSKTKPLILKIDIDYKINNSPQNLTIYYNLNSKKVLKIESSVLY